MPSILLFCLYIDLCSLFVYRLFGHLVAEKEPNSMTFISESYLLTDSEIYFFCLFSVTFHLLSVHIIFCSVWVAEWPPFGKELLTRLTICSLCSLTICNFS